MDDDAREAAKVKGLCNDDLRSGLLSAAHKLTLQAARPGNDALREIAIGVRALAHEYHNQLEKALRRR